MLMSLGPVTFDYIAFNLMSHEGEANWSYAKHDVFGGAPLYEATGTEESPIELAVMLHPEHFGGLDNLTVLKTAAGAQVPLPLMRGDFVPIGWHIVKSVKDSHDMLGFGGIGREVNCSISLLRTSRPGIGFAGQILRLFA